MRLLLLDCIPGIEAALTVRSVLTLKRQPGRPVGGGGGGGPGARTHGGGCVAQECLRGSTTLDTVSLLSILLFVFLVKNQDGRPLSSLFTTNWGRCDLRLVGGDCSRSTDSAVCCECPRRMISLAQQPAWHSFFDAPGAQWCGTPPGHPHDPGHCEF